MIPNYVSYYLNFFLTFNIYQILTKIKFIIIKYESCNIKLLILLVIQLFWETHKYQATFEIWYLAEVTKNVILFSFNS